MIIEEVLKLTEPVTAAENMADKLADRIRNIWLEKQKLGVNQWEDNFSDDPEGVKFLRCEAFPHLEGIDYIFQWWDEPDADGMSGKLVVLLKVLINLEMRMYQVTIRFTKQDLLLDDIELESEKRKATRKEFRKAFAVWQRIYQRDVAR